MIAPGELRRLVDTYFDEAVFARQLGFAADTREFRLTVHNRSASPRRMITVLYSDTGLIRGRLDDYFKFVDFAYDESEVVDAVELAFALARAYLSGEGEIVNNPTRFKKRRLEYRVAVGDEFFSLRQKGSERGPRSGP